MLGTACGLGVQGSGWVAGDGLVVTNAHVVAGQDDTTVQLGGEGAALDAEAIWFDPRNDLAILRVPGLSGAPALRLNVNAAQGTSAADPRLPRERPVHVAAGAARRHGHGDHPGRLRARARCERSITSLRGRVRPGNSGGPVVDALRARGGHDLRGRYQA